MRAVLLSGAPYVGGAVLVEGVEALRSAGRDVVLVSWVAPPVALAAACTATVVLGPTTVPAAAAAPAPPQGRVRRRVAQLGALAHRRSGRFAAAVRRDSRAQESASRADLLVAVDREAILATWRLARGRAAVTALFGLTAAVTAMAEPAAPPATG
jgi:hypothetical protein